MKHKKEIAYPGGIDQLAADLGNLRYDTLQVFLTELARKVRLDGNKDRTKGRVQLSSHLDKAADKLLGAAAEVGIAWIISKPHMENGDGS